MYRLVFPHKTSKSGENIGKTCTCNVPMWDGFLLIQWKYKTEQKKIKMEKNKNKKNENEIELEMKEWCCCCSTSLCIVWRYIMGEEESMCWVGVTVEELALFLALSMSICLKMRRVGMVVVCSYWRSR